jgi:hypothetical protein
MGGLLPWMLHFLESTKQIIGADYYVDLLLVCKCMPAAWYLFIRIVEDRKTSE